MYITKHCTKHRDVIYHLSTSGLSYYTQVSK